MNIIKKIHLWLSIPFGLVISITCFTGAMLVFEKEITAAVSEEINRVEPIGNPLSVDELASTVATTLTEDVKVTGVTFTDDPTQAYQVSLSKPHRASVYVNQYTGEILGQYERLPFFTTMFRMHRWLMDTRPNDGGLFWGKIIVGISTLVFVVILISGLIVWLPRNRKMLKNRLKISYTKGWSRFWFDLHVAGGFYVLVVLLAMALTGLTWSFPWYRTVFYKVLGVELQASNVTSNSNKRGDSVKQANVLPFANWQKACDEVVRLRPEYSKVSVKKGEVTVSVARLGNQRATDKYKFDFNTGEIIDVEMYKDSNKQSKIRGWIYSVHVGSFGGMFTRILAFLSALFGASLPLTGYYLWIKRLYRIR